MQIRLAAIVCLMGLYLLTNVRMARLVLSHRSFAIGLQDMSHPRRQAPAADRTGVSRYRQRSI